MATPKGSSTPKPIRQPDRPTEPDPSDLLEKLSLQQSSSQDIPLPSAPASGTSIDSQASSLHRAHLESVQRSRVHALELSEQSLFLPLLPSVLPFASFAKIGGGMGRGLDPKVLVAKVLDLAGDRGPIRRRSRREIECDDGMRWEVVLEGFHHLTDELDALDPLTSSSLATLKSSSRWDSLFDPSSPYTPESPVIVEDAAYGIPSSLLPLNVRDEINALLGAENGNSAEDKVAPDVEEEKKGLSREAREALEECAKRGAVGFGIRWSNPGKVGEGESLWGWIWGEEASQSNEDYDDEEDDEGEDGGEDETRYKAVHFVKAEEEEGDEGAAGGKRGGDNGQDEELVNDGGDLGDL